MNKQELIRQLENRLKQVRLKVEKRRLDMVNQDGPNESRYITATRWLVEQEIESLDREVARLTNGLKEVSRLVEDQTRFSDKYFVSDSFECVDLGIISKKTEIGKKIVESNTAKT